jgi:N-acetylglucosaminyldiphosphoundecaprenol N-acetyl-beta-D-mannosaminyltransferase
MTSDTLSTLTLLNVEFLNITKFQAIELVAKAINANTQKIVYFVNADCLNKTVADSDYLHILQQGDYILADGSGIKLGCKILGDTVIDNVNGTDLLPLICELAVKNHFSIYLLGAKPGVAAQTKDNLEKQYSGLRIVGEWHGYFRKNSDEEQDVIRNINESQADILLVAFGAPFQEKWIHSRKHQLTAKVLIGVGGLFDFYSGNIPRAPLWLRRYGLEWTYRLYQEPKRMFKRYILGNPLFVYRVYKWKWFSRRPRKSEKI